ncbi:PEP-CTERM sorting domain-containing protein [Roseiconus lacunae]|uniref:PEP-CTERM sorting domain-containing protein n=1 Tax=Roseiconus lacunae TaxID=2605694 RepID=UPI0033153F23
MPFRLSFGLFLLLALVSQSVSAAPVTYDVDLGGTSRQGRFLRVFGTITVDADLLTSQGVIGSSLQVQRASEAPLSLPSVPGSNGAVNTSLDWVVDGEDLYISRISDSPTTAFIRWDGLGGSPSRTFTLGAGSTIHSIFLSTGPDTTVLKDDSGIDGPFGFRVGTVSAIPEPSSLLALTAIGTAAVFRRKRRVSSAG